MKLSVKSFMKDSVLNIFVTFVPLFVLQFIVYPILADKMSQEQYGLMISCYSLMYLIGGTLGTELNKVRLVNEAKYAQNNIKGDFNIVLLGNILLGAFLCLVLSKLLMTEIAMWDVAFLTITCIFIILNSYLDVGFRLELNYKRIAIVQLINVVGYIVGTLIYLMCGEWIFVFLSGLIMGAVYFFSKTKLIKEPYQKTLFFRETVKDDIHLACAGLLNRILLYGDKLLLLPLGGSGMVSIYYIATLIGKTILMSIEPINTVLLSYLVKMKSVGIKEFKKILLLLIIVCSFGYAICMLLSEPILNFLYPMWIDETRQLIWVATLAMCLSAMGNIVNSFVLKECPMKWQSIINLIVAIVFVLFAVLLIQSSGLFGYCIAVAIAYFVRLLITIVMYYIHLKKGH